MFVHLYQKEKGTDMNKAEMLKRLHSVIDCLTESDGGNAVTESDVKDAKVELNELISLL